MSLDHFCLNVPEAKFQDCLKFYLAALTPLGYEKIHQFGDYVVGFGSPTTEPSFTAYQRADFWLIGKPDASSSPCHLGFRAKNRQEVHAFYEGAIKSGAKGNGEPGVRTMYDANYYAAFALDPEGNNIEAVCRTPE